MAAGGATGGVIVWDCRRPGAGGAELEEEDIDNGTNTSKASIGNTSDGSKRARGPGPTADLRNNGHEYGVPVSHLAAYPDGSFFVSADTTTLKVEGRTYFLPHKRQLSRKVGPRERFQSGTSHFRLCWPQ